MASRRLLVASTVLLVLFALSVATFFWDAPAKHIVAFSQENLALTAVLFTLLMFAATVVAPLTATPAIPVAASILPPALVGMLSVIGWGSGAVVAFIIARRYGKPILKRFVSIGEVEKYEHYIPPRLGFLTLVLLRMVVPVDALSYTLGLVSTMRLSTYTLATFIGITPFSFIFAYSGAAFFEGEFVTLLFFAVTGITLFAVVWYVLRRARKRDMLH